MQADSVEDFVRDQLSAGAQRTARLILNWLRRHPEALDTINEVYAAGASGDPDPFLAFAGVVWNEINAEFGGILESWDIAPDDDRNWISTVALVVGAWGYIEMQQRGSA